MQQRQGRSRGIALLAIPLLILLWLIWNAAGPDEADGAIAPPTPSREPERPVLARVERAVVAAEVRADLTEPVPVPVPEPDLEHPYAYELDVRLVDMYGLPVPGAMVFAAPMLCGFSLWPNLSNSRGEVRLRWQARVGHMQFQVATMAWGVLQPLRLFDLDAERPNAKVLVVRGREQPEDALAQLRRRTPDGLAEDARNLRRGRLKRSDELDVLCGRTMLLFRDFECGICHEPSRIAGYATLARSGVIAKGLHPAAIFSDLGAGQLSDAQRKERQKMLEASEEPKLPMSGGETGVTMIRGVVREPDGKPAARVPVSWLGETGALRRRTWTNADGRYFLGPVSSGLQLVVAGGAEGGEARATLNVYDGVTVHWDFQLERSGVIRGSARDETGGLLVDWRVEFERDEGDWADLATTHKDGGFLMSGVPGMGRCLLWPNDADLRLPVAYGRPAVPDSDPVVFALDAQVPTRARMRLRVVLPMAKAPPPVDAHIFQLDTGRGAVLPPSRFDDQLELGGLAAGPYRIEVGAPTLGWVDCGSKHVDGRGMWDLGYVTLPAPGRVKLRTAAGMPLQCEHALYRRLESMDVLESSQPGTDGSLLLPAGEHLLLWKDEDVLRSLTFTVTPGKPVDVDVPAR